MCRPVGSELSTSTVPFARPDAVSSVPRSSVDCGPIMVQGNDAVQDANQVCVDASCPSSWFPPPDLTVSTFQMGEASPRLCIIVSLETEDASHLWVFWASWCRHWEPRMCMQ